MNHWSELLPWNLSTSALWIIAVGSLTNVSCALVGCYLILRRMSLMGDAISHAVLPGLVFAFLFTGSLGIFPLFVGAAVAGLLTTFLTQLLHEHGRISTDASMGVVFTSLFALGVVLLKRYISGLHFDVACVYEGSLLQVALNTTPLLGWDVPRQLLTVGAVMVLNALFVALFWKELKICSFDPGLADALGISSTMVHYLLMTMVAVTAVASFEAVGSILVVAMLIVPGATAHLLTDRLAPMLWIATAVAVLSAVLGYLLAKAWNVTPAGTMTMAAGAMYAAAVFFAPRYGVASKLWHNTQTSVRVLREDVLAMLYRIEEVGSQHSLTYDEAAKAIGGGALARWGIHQLLRVGQVARESGHLVLTASGRDVASHLVRSHRLWEAYLVEHLNLPLDHVHDPAERMEHFIDERMQQELKQELSDSEQDPHGRDIPK